MAMDRAALLRQIAESNASGGGNYFRDSRGRVCVRKTSLETGFGGNRFVIEFMVVSSVKIQVFAIQTKPGQVAGQALDIEPYAPGAIVSEVYMLGDPKKDPGFGKTKKFVMEAYGMTGDISPDDLVEVLDELDKNNTARGIILDYATRRIETKTNKEEITVVDFTNVPGSDAAEQKAAYVGWMDQMMATAAAAATQPAAQASA